MTAPGRWVQRPPPEGGPALLRAAERGGRALAPVAWRFLPSDRWGGAPNPRRAQGLGSLSAQEQLVDRVVGFLDPGVGEGVEELGEGLVVLLGDDEADE